MDGTTSTSPPPQPTADNAESGSVTVVGEEFHISEAVSNPESRAEGLLLNSRMVQAVIDIEGDASVFAYPDIGKWDPARNTAEFTAAIPSYVAAGLNAVTVNLQGGNPLAEPVTNRPPWTISAYTPDGSVQTDWLERLNDVLEVADRNGMVVILGLFYFGQDHVLQDERAVLRAVDGITDWLVERGHHNVLIEVCNECNVHYDHPILQPDRVGEIVTRIQERSDLLVSASLSGGRIPSGRLLDMVDFVLLHGNRQDADDIGEMVEKVRGSSAFQADPKPIVFNEDSTGLENMEAALKAGAGWGYHDKGLNNYRDGFQAPPVDWTISTEAKRSFFEAVAVATGSN